MDLTCLYGNLYYLSLNGGMLLSKGADRIGVLVYRSTVRLGCYAV